MMVKKLGAALVFGIILSGCASVHEPKTMAERDPLEGFNRTMFTVHDAIDTAVLEPVAKGYDYVMPQPVKTGVSNFFSNVGDVPGMANSLLQWNLEGFATSLWRVIINTTLGIGGVFDIASEMGLDKQSNDFGKTLAVWGLDTGPYLVIPLIGPTNVRDLSGKVVDFNVTDPVGYIGDIPVRNSLYGIRVVDTRYNLLNAMDAVNDAALDKYDYVRNAYMQMRYYQIYDKKMPVKE